MRRRHSLLAVAIERKDWETAALLLLLGVSRAAKKLPPETLEEMLTELSEITPRRRASRRRGTS
jgi:hypothetical protein